MLKEREREILEVLVCELGDFTPVVVEVQIKLWGYLLGVQGSGVSLGNRPTDHMQEKDPSGLFL